MDVQDDFAADVAAAVETGNTDVPVDTSDLQGQPAQPSAEGPALSDVEKEVLSRMGESEFEADQRKAAEAAAAKKAAAEQSPPQQQAAPQQPQQVKPATDDKTPYLDRFLKDDGKGNLVTDDGTVIAAAGKAREFYEAVKREGRQAREHATTLAVSNQQLGERFKELFTAYKEAQAAAQNVGNVALAKHLGTDERAAQEILSLARQYQQDPVAAIKSILTKAQMDGINLASIGIQGQLDPATVRQMLTGIVQEHIAPISQNYQQQQREAAVQREVEQFWAEFSDLKEHEATIAEAFRRQSGQMSLREIGLRLRQWLYQQQEGRAQEQRPAQPQQSVQQPAPAQPAQQRRVVTPPKQTVDYASMSFEQIAQEIAKELR